MTDAPTSHIVEKHAKPCPFCGGRDVRTMRTNFGQWFTTCYLDDGRGCGARTDIRYTAIMALISWNRRA